MELEDIANLKFVACKSVRVQVPPVVPSFLKATIDLIVSHPAFQWEVVSANLTCQLQYFKSPLKIKVKNIIKM